MRLTGQGGQGLSPRGRGNRLVCGGYSCQVRTIPAWAGEPRPYLRWLMTRRDYPRVGGGTEDARLNAGRVLGLSPRGRGNLDKTHRERIKDRTIPAWAGEPSTYTDSIVTDRDYPRVGGGTQPYSCFGAYHKGLSPRGRGNLVSVACGVVDHRTIPAWAGEPCKRGLRRSRSPDYPRVGGGTDDASPIWQPGKGLSPRGRGNPEPEASVRTGSGTIPAWAGEPF